MTKVLIMTGSVRDVRAVDKIIPQVKEALTHYPNLEVTFADLKDMPMPFFDSAIVPSVDGYAPTDENVLKFGKLVSENDIVLILTPEYNHSYPAVLKNAIDWLYKEWHGKKIAFIGYGWVGGARSINHLHGVFEFLQVEHISPEANLRFTKEIDMDGSALNDDAKAAINSVLQAL